MTITLDILYTDAASLLSIHNGRRIFFVLTYIDPDIITLSGFTTTGNGAGGFDPNPAIVLRKAGSMIFNQSTLYVGNVEIDPPDVQQIQREIRNSGAAFVLFIPGVSTTYPDHIFYTTGLSMDDPAVKKNPTILEPLTTPPLNPSPPKALS